MGWSSLIPHTRKKNLDRDDGDEPRWKVEKKTWSEGGEREARNSKKVRR